MSGPIDMPWWPWKVEKPMSDFDRIALNACVNPDDLRAILREMLEPSEGMKQAAMSLEVVKALDGMVQMAFVHGNRLPEGEPPLWQAYRAMLQHIIDEGTVVHTAASSVLHDSNRSKSARVAAGLSLTQRSKRR